MPELEVKDDDIFHVIGFTGQEDPLHGMPFRAVKLSQENRNANFSLFQQFGRLALAVQRGLVVKKLIEIYFLDPFSFLDDDTFERRFSNKYQVVDFYNETALALSKQYHIQLPPVIFTLTRAELPKPLGTSMRDVYFTLP